MAAAPRLSVSFHGRGAVQCARVVPHFDALPSVHSCESAGRNSRVWCILWSEIEWYAGKQLDRQLWQIVKGTSEFRGTNKEAKD